MEETKRMTRSNPQFKDIPELIHHIQLLLPVKEAARTCILSKSWLHAWSTIPTLRFGQANLSLYASKEQERKRLEVVNATLLRYLRDNIPIELIDLEIYIDNQEVDSLAGNWIRSVAAKSCLKQLYLSILGSFKLPDEMLSGRNINKIWVTGSRSLETRPLMISGNTVIKCVSLGELVLTDVHICEDVLHNLLSYCSFLRTIKLLCCTGWNTIKVKNLKFLYELTIHPNEGNGILKIDDVPNLCLFTYNSVDTIPRSPLPFNTDSLGSVIDLMVDGLIMDYTFFDLLKSKLPFLENLTLGMERWRLESFYITCVQLKRLSLCSCNQMLIAIEVYAPKLHFFHYDGTTMPSLSFPATAPKKIEVVLQLMRYLLNEDHLILRRIMGTLKLSSEFDIEIRTHKLYFPVPFKFEVAFTARNVQRLSIVTIVDGVLRRPLFFDVFFSICHPRLLVVRRDLYFMENHYFGNLVVREVLEKKTRKGYWSDYLQGVEIKNPVNGRWEILTDSWRSFLEGLTEVPWSSIELKLNWCSPNDLHL